MAAIFLSPAIQAAGGLCIADFFRSKASGEYDVLGMQLVTVGDKATEACRKTPAANRYQEYLYLHGFGVESAEGLAELLAQTHAAGTGLRQRGRSRDRKDFSSRTIEAAAIVLDIRHVRISKIGLR